MARFHWYQSEPRRAGAGALISLLVHGALILPVVVKHRLAPPSTDPIDAMVVFLVPPDRPTGAESHGSGVDWSGLMGTNGADRPPLPRDPQPEETIPLGPAGDQTPSVPEAPAAPNQETALTEIEVDSAVVRDPTSSAPVYPAALLAQRIEGATFVHYVVDTLGRVDTTTIQVIRSTHPEFAAAVRQALAGMRFRPAIQASQRVRQWVQQNFSFRITKAVIDST